MNFICLNRHNFTNLKLYNKLLIKALTFTITGVSTNQEIFIFNIKKSFLLDEYNYDVLKVLVWAFSIHLYENLLFPVWFIYFFSEYITFHSYSLHQCPQSLQTSYSILYEHLCFCLNTIPEFPGILKHITNDFT